MPTGMGATNPKFAKSVRKPKRTEHCTIPEWWQKKKVPIVRSINEKRELIISNIRNQEDIPNMKFGGIN